MSDPNGEARSRDADAPAAAAATEAARAIADRYWDDLLALEPVMATQVGDDRFDDRLPDTTEDGVARAREVHESARAAAATIDRSLLAEAERTALDVLDAVVRRALEDIRMRNDRLAGVTHMLGPGQLLVQLGSLQRADTPEALDRYVTRLRGFPSFLDGLAAGASAAAADGITQPRLVVDRTIAQFERLLQVPPEDSPALAPVAASPPGARERVLEVLRDVVYPAYQRYLSMLRSYREGARSSIGLSDLPGGAERYAVEILAYTTVELTAEEAHQIGLDEMAAIETQQQEIATRLGFATVQEAMAAYRADGKDTPSSREEIVRLAEDCVRRGWEGAPVAFSHLPEAECEVRPVEEFREKDTPFAYYQPGSGDRSRRGIFYVNTGDHSDAKLHVLAAVAFHEANPGHHFQISMEQEHADRLALRRFGGFLLGSAFIEGWGLYSERLADELGLYAGEYERIGMLEAQAWRAARLVTDSGIHALGWDRERAVDYLDHATGGPRGNSEIEIDRYIAWPAQALSYMIGQRELQRFRREAEARLGNAFSLPGFHDRLLSLGSLPLPVLQRELSRS
jgi:uncharacterized protein (DUF885 family)